MTRLWVNGPTEASIQQFTLGDCWILAWALNKRGGWPIIGLCEGDWPEHVDTEGVFFHTLVRISRNRYLDVNGISTLADLREEWTEGCPISTTRQRWLEDEASPPASTWTYDRATTRALRLADQLIRRHQL